MFFEVSQGSIMNLDEDQRKVKRGEMQYRRWDPEDRRDGRVDLGLFTRACIPTNTPPRLDVLRSHVFFLLPWTGSESS